MEVVKFTQFLKESQSINESIDLYRLVAVGEDEHLVVDTNNPGKYYFQSKNDIKKDVVSKDAKEYHVIKVTTSDSNIDKELSDQETEKQGCVCVVLKDDSKADIESITPFK